MMKQFELQELLNFVKYKDFHTQELKINNLRDHLDKIFSILENLESKNHKDYSYYPPAWVSFEKESVSFFEEYFSYMNDDEDIKEEIEYLDEEMPHQEIWLPCYIKSYRSNSELTFSIGNAFIVINVKESLIYINFENKIDKDKTYEINSDLKILDFINWFIPLMEEEYSKIYEDRDSYYKDKESISWKHRYSKIKTLDYVAYALRNEEELYLFSEMTKDEISYFLDNKEMFIESKNDPIYLNKSKVLEVIRLSLESINIIPKELSDSDFYAANRLVRDPFHYPEEKSNFITIGDTEQDFEDWFNDEDYKTNDNFFIEIGEFNKSFILEAYRVGDKFKFKIYTGETMYSATSTIKIVKSLNEMGIPISLVEAQEYYNYLNGDTFVGIEPYFSTSYRKEKLNIETPEKDMFSLYKSTDDIISHKIPDEIIIKYKIDSYFK